MICQNILNKLLLKSIAVSCSILFMTTACSNDSRLKTEIREMFGQHIVFPDDYIILYDNHSQDVKKLLEKKKKLVVYLDYSLPCSDCYLDTFEKMEKGLSEITNDKNSFLIVMSNVSLDDDFREKCIERSLNISIVYYKTDEFSVTNKLSDKLAKNKTFMVNENNNVIAVGEFFNSPQLKRIYRKAINSQDK